MRHTTFVSGMGLMYNFPNSEDFQAMPARNSGKVRLQRSESVGKLLFCGYAVAAVFNCS